MNFFPRMALLLLGLCLLPVRAQTITNFTSSKTVYDCIGVGSLLWVGTSGGFYIHDFSTGASWLRPANQDFPDPSIRALAVDSLLNMWIASHDGYLMRRDQNWDEYFNYSYNAAGWRINALAAYGNYLIVGSDKGVSLFDIKKQIAVKNSQKIGTGFSPVVYTIAIHENHLYVGGESGTARLKVALKNIAGANFYDPSLWEIDTSVAPVYSFYEDSGKIVPASGPTGRMLGLLLTTGSESNSNKIIVHDKKTYSITLDSSKITTIKSIGEDRCVIGTEEHHFFYWDAEEGIRNMTIPGPTFASANRVHVDRSGKLWVLPYGDPRVGFPWYPMPMWLGINSFNGTSWKNYSPMQHIEIGHMASSTEARAITESIDGRMWFGFNGGAIKSYAPEKDEWWHYCNFGQSGQYESWTDPEGEVHTFIKRQAPCPEIDWGKCDAIAQDSAGYMWFGSWNSPAGCLLCYKPSSDENENLEGRYRRFPPYGATDMDVTIPAIAVDPSQNILFGTKTGELNVVRHRGNPIKDGIEKIIEFRNLQNVYRIVVLNNGTSIVLTASGVMLFDPSDMTLSSMDEFENENGVSVLAAENDHMFWYAVADKGVVRFDYLNGVKTVFGRAQGLVSTKVNDLFVDRDGGNLWVATDRGVSRIALGYSSSSPGKEQNVVVFPNPYSFKRHSLINFRNVPVGAKVGIYSIGGQLVGRPESVIGNENSALYRWKPSSRIAPGTYFYAIVTTTEKKTGKLLLVP